MKGFFIALQFMTRLPGPRMTVSPDAFAASIRWFPATGLVVGGIVAGGAWTGALVDPWLAALLALILWVGVTGALHLDGLGDIADAAGAAHKGRDRILTVLADPHIGSFGAVAIGLQLIAKLVLLHGLTDGRLIEAGTTAALVLIPFAARIGPLLWSRTLPPLHDGLGARFREALGLGTIAIWLLLLLAASWFVPALLLAIPIIICWNFWILRTVGGISGDGHGAGIEIIETGLLVGAMVLGEWG